MRPLIDTALAAGRYDRRRYFEVLHRIGEPALAPLVDAVLPLVGTEQPINLDPGVSPLAPIGPAVLPELRRRRRTPGRYRRQALAALAEIGGWAALDAADQALIRRLIRVKQAHEVPQPIDVQSTWFAVRTVEQAAVLDAFDLSDAEPVTMLLGTYGWHYVQRDRLGEAMYVSPGLNGWTLVFGEPGCDGIDSLNDLTVALSRRFGAAHWYYLFERHQRLVRGRAGTARPVVPQRDAAEADRATAAGRAGDHDLGHRCRRRDVGGPDRPRRHVPGRRAWRARADGPGPQPDSPWQPGALPI